MPLRLGWRRKVGAEVAGIPIEAAYGEATAALEAAALVSGANALIHVGYDYRMATQQIGCNQSEPSFEVYAWGAAVTVP